uniref:Uncharacterized protein n=2 Tax=unclassified Caudoviricetes TaxID=2788787 RepID=A0A8S5PIR1_9CAUD|nr:MAG TPA: hypothetical protein [Siphoviridae sp. ctJcm18]DAE06608.1 MAG TPA: hypothetical protein [Siphoviridae sp. ctUGQ45]DAV73366.1 MAG TPA: hypothetical protein [Bacteriophage sp.]
MVRLIFMFFLRYMYINLYYKCMYITQKEHIYKI